MSVMHARGFLERITPFMAATKESAVPKSVVSVMIGTDERENAATG
jgi:hypothetical protein